MRERRKKGGGGEIGGTKDLHSRRKRAIVRRGRGLSTHKRKRGNQLRSEKRGKRKTTRREERGGGLGLTQGGRGVGGKCDEHIAHAREGRESMGAGGKILRKTDSS